MDNDIHNKNRFDREKLKKEQRNLEIILDKLLSLFIDNNYYAVFTCMTCFNRNYPGHFRFRLFRRNVNVGKA